MYILTHAEIEAEIAYRRQLCAADPRPWDSPQLADINRLANEIHGLRSALASLAHFLLANEIHGLRSALASLAHFLAMLDWRPHHPGLGAYIERRRLELGAELGRKEGKLRRLWNERIRD